MDTPAALSPSPAAPASAPRGGRRAGLWLKAAVSAGLLAAVVGLSQPERVLAALAGADARWLAAAAALWLGIQWLYVVKWYWLNRAQGLAMPFGKLWELYFVGTFFNTFLPSGFGGDAVRAYRLAQLSGRAGASLASVLIDRFTSLYALLLVGTAAVFMAPAAWQVVPAWLVVSLDAAGALAFGLWLHGGALRRLAGWGALARWPRLGAALQEAAEAAVALRAAPGAWILALGLSIGYQVLAVVLHHWLMLALGLSVPFGYALVFVPLLTLAISLPVSINGIGVREGGFAYFLGKLGFEAGAGVSVGLLSLALVLASAAWGAVIASRLRPERGAP